MLLARFLWAVAIATPLFIEGVGSASAVNALETSTRLTPENLVESVLAANPRFEAIQAAARIASFRIVPAGALDDPVASYELAPGTISGFRTGLNQRVTVSQALPWPGKLGLREKTARAEADAATERVGDVRTELVAATYAAFSEWYFIHKALVVNDEVLTLLVELQRVAESEYAAGRGTQQAALQIAVEHTELKRQRIEYETQRRIVLARINALLNRSPDMPLARPADPAMPIALLPVKELRTYALAQYPELKQLAAELRADETRVRLAEKEFYPDFRAMGGYNSLWDESEKQWTVGFSINVPLDFSKRRATLGASQAAAKRTEWELADRRSTVLAELEKVRSRIVETERTVSLYRDEILPLTDDALHAAEADYRTGGADFLNVINAERSKLSAELSLARANADYLRNLATLDRLTGGAILNLTARPSVPLTERHGR